MTVSSRKRSLNIVRLSTAVLTNAMLAQHFWERCCPPADRILSRSNCAAMPRGVSAPSGPPAPSKHPMAVPENVTANVCLIIRLSAHIRGRFQREVGTGSLRASLQPTQTHYIGCAARQLRRRQLWQRQRCRIAEPPQGLSRARTKLSRLLRRLQLSHLQSRQQPCVPETQRHASRN